MGIPWCFFTRTIGKAAMDWAELLTTVSEFVVHCEPFMRFALHGQTSCAHGQGGNHVRVPTQSVWLTP